MFNHFTMLDHQATATITTTMNNNFSAIISVYTD